MQREETGRYEVAVAGGESVRAFVPAALPPVPPIVLEGDLPGCSSRRCWPSGGSTVPRRCCAMPISSSTPTCGRRRWSRRRSRARSRRCRICCSSRSRRRRGTVRRCGRVVELRRGDGAWARATAGGIPAEQPPHPARSMGCLLSRGRGSAKDPGNFRRTQNWIGGSRPGNARFRAAAAATRRGLHVGPRAVPARRTGRGCRRSFAPRWRTCSSRPSILSSTAMAASAAC